MFTENLFKLLLNLEEGWVVKTVLTDITKGKVSIEIACTLRELEDKETGEMCKIYDHAPKRSFMTSFRYYAIPNVYQLWATKNKDRIGKSKDRSTHSEPLTFKTNSSENFS